MCDEDLRFLLGDWHSDSWAGAGLPSPGTARTSKLFRPLSGSDCDKVLYQTEAIQGRELILAYSFRGMGVHHGSQQQEQELKVGILKCRGDSSGLLTRKDPSGCFYSS